MIRFLDTLKYTLGERLCVALVYVMTQPDGSDVRAVREYGSVLCTYM